MHIPYKGSTPAMNDTIGGQVPIAYDTILATTPQHNAGRVRALAVTSINRSALLPNIPTLAESGLKDFNIVAWQAVVGPKGLPADVKAVLQKALKAVMEDPAFVEKMAATGFDVNWSPANDWAQMIRSEIAESKDIAAKAKITIE
jgi:tripartite-type tricarboxylate transporter receptor subunit TctC